MRCFFSAVVLFVITISIVSANSIGEGKNYPVEVFKNKFLKVTVLLPDAEHGYYRSTRFDWSGIIAQVEYDGHTYFQEWENYNGTITPGNHDPLKAGTGTGTVEEFRDAPGYEEAKPGDPFLKIGVGVLERADEKPYHWDFPYKVIEPGTWKVRIRKNSIRFIQKIKTDFGYAYRYEKTIILNDNNAELEIIHNLKNTGEKEIHANPYCHNFFQFDGQEIGTDYKIEFPKPIKAIDEFDSRVTIQYNSLKLNSELSGSDWVGGHIDPAEAKTFVLKNSKTKTAVEVVSNVVPGPFYLYLWKLSFCPEPMIELDIQPGEESSWKRSYRFRK